MTTATSALLKRFRVTREDFPTAFLGDTELSVDDVDDEAVSAECELSALVGATFDEFPDGLTVRIHSPDGFGTFLFDELSVSRDANETSVEFRCHHPNKYWEGTFGLATLLRAVRDQVEHVPDVSVGEVELEDDWKLLSLRFVAPAGPASEAVASFAGVCKRLVREAEVALAGVRWKPEYLSNERSFCEEVLAPLLRRMGFLSSRYIQGAREYGKDFTFSELTPFGIMRHYGLQAKAGDVRGEVNSAVDELIGQVSDAFAMPYYELGSHEPRFISTFVIAISGRFTANAREKIVQKIPKGLHGSVLFLDREILQGLVERHWK